MIRYFQWFGLPGAVVLTLLMSALALILALCKPSLVQWFCFCAMALSSVGDIFLANIDRLKKDFPNYFVIGAAFFMAAHLMYILCFTFKIHGANTPFWNTGAIFALLAGLLTIALLAKTCSTQNMTGFILIGIYGLIITANLTTVFSYACSQGLRSVSAVSAAIGVVSFLLSDVIIGLGIAGNIHQYDHLIWWLYPIGQILLILSV